MRKVIALAVALLFPSALVAGGKIKLNVKTGLWQTTNTNTVSGGMGIPATKKKASGTPRTVTHKDCLTAEKLAEDPFTDRAHGDNAKCEETVIKSTTTDLEVHELCTYGNSKAEIHLSLHADSPEHVTGSGTTTATADGHVMNSTMKMDSKWISATCPAGTR